MLPEVPATADSISLGLKPYIGNANIVSRQVRHFLNVPTKERAYVRYAWLIFAVQGALVFFGGLLGFLVPSFELRMPNVGYLGCSLSCMTGRSFTQIAALDPGIANYITTLYGFLGAIDICFSLLVIVVAATSFRRGERWAWYAIWTFLLRQVFEVVFSGQPPIPIGVGATLLGLFLPYRKFFPKRAAPSVTAQ